MKARELINLVRELDLSANHAGATNGLIPVSKEKLLAVYRTALDLESIIEGTVEDDDPNRTVTLDLNVFKAGVVVDRTIGVVSIAQISDIVDHAAQVVLEERDGKEVDLTELEDALVVADIIRERE